MSDFSSASPAVLTVQHDPDTVDIAAALPKIFQQTGQKPLAVVKDFLSLTFAPGRVSFVDYVRLRLFDRAFWPDVDRKTILGQRRNLNLAVQANWRHDWFGLMANKIAATQYLAQYGLPMIPTAAIYAPFLMTAAAQILNTPSDLKAFLSSGDNYPLFGKPVEGKQSLGSVALQSYAAHSQSALKPDGTSVALDDLIRDIDQNYADTGYVFQPLVRPHADLVARIGSKLATARIVTIATEDGPKVFRASWKIQTGQNMADN